MTRRRDRRWRIGAALVAVATLAVTLSACRATPPEIVLYGDSLSGPNQTGALFDYFLAHDGRTQVVDKVFAGTGPCQWLPEMRTDAAAGAMSVAVLEFSGDAFGCESYPPESQAYYDAYRSQVTEAAELFSRAGVHTFLIGTPISWSAVQSHDAGWDRLNRIYAQVAASVPDTTFVNAGASVERDGEFTWTLPCLPTEPSCGPGGRNLVRARDGGHFCTLDPNSVNCGDYSSGAVRFALAEAGAVQHLLSTGSAPAYWGPPLPPPDTPARAVPRQLDPYFVARDILPDGSSIGVGQFLRSLDGRYTAILQSDGNFVCYGPQGPVWSTQTTGSDARALVLQADGTLVLSGDAGALWTSGVTGPGPFTLALTDGGQLVVYGSLGQVWSS